ncbi:MAG TPA: tetratricopeptide repeat protein, partial [Gemmatirosa sp.]
QVAGVRLENRTALPEAPPMAATAYVPPTRAGLGGVEVKVIACGRSATRIVCVASVAGAYVALPAWSAASVHVPAAMKLTGAAAVVVAAVIGAALLGRAAERRAPDAPASAELRTIARAVPALAVLPFENVGAPGDAYFADGVGDELASRLTSLQGLRVIPPRSAREYRGSAKPPAQVGRELGADYLLTGQASWDRSGGAGRVRVTAELVRARDGSAVWADRYVADAADVIAVEGQIGERVAAALELALGEPARRTLATRPTVDFEAYSAFLRGEALRTAPAGDAAVWREAVGEYGRAVVRDPHFALAYARLSEVHSLLYHWNADPTERRLALARDAAERAVRLDPALAEAHLALALCAYYGDRDYDRALDEITRALRAQPGRGEFLSVRGYVLRRQGRLAEAAATLAHAVEVDPRSAVAAADAAATFAMMRAFPEAMQYYERAVALAPDRMWTQADVAQLLVAWRGDTAGARRVVRDALKRGAPGPLVARLDDEAMLLLGDGPAERAAVRALTPAAFGGDTTQYLLWVADWARLHGAAAHGRAAADSARRRLEPLVAAHPDAPGPQMALGRAYAQLGRHADALRVARRAVALPAVARDAIDRMNLEQNLAYVETLAGAHGDAIAQLARLLAGMSDYTPALLRLDQRWAPLRADARFRQMISMAP